MRIAVLADIHGNIAAFEAALQHVRQQRVDQIIIAGDVVVGSPDSADCWQLAKSLGCPMLRGNHERYLAHFGTPQAAPEWSTERFTPLHWAAPQFSEQERRAMEQLPAYLRLPEAPDLLFVHASERGDHDSVESHTPVEKLAAMFPTAQERYLIRSHNHYGQVRVWDQRFIVTSGSVGLALDGNPTAQYLLLEQAGDGWKIQNQSVPYDVHATARRFRETGYLDFAGPMGRLFYREVVTASQQIVPFLKLYQQWSEKENLPLDQAVERFYQL